jgi:large subunit ribosomal protein LX
MKGFRVTGSFRISKGNWQKFTVEVAAQDEGGAEDRVLSNIGSRHRVNRNEVKITGVESVSNDEILDPVVKYQVEGG